MIILKKRVIKFPSKKVLSKGKSLLLDETLDNWKRFKVDPGKAINDTVGDMIEHPIASGIETVVESGLGLVGKIPGLKVPGVSKTGRKIEDAILPNKVKETLSRKSRQYKESKIAGKIEKEVNNKVGNISKLFSNREKVPSDIEKKAREEGVIQKDSNGVWRIISLKTHPAEYWNAHYKTKEDAERALSAYHANK